MSSKESGYSATKAETVAIASLAALSKGYPYSPVEMEEKAIFLMLLSRAVCMALA